MSVVKIRKSAIIENALRDLKFVRYQLRRAGSKKAADYVCRAIKSTEGALRNAQRFEFQNQQTERTKTWNR